MRNFSREKSRYAFAFDMSDWNGKMEAKRDDCAFTIAAIMSQSVGNAGGH